MKISASVCLMFPFAYDNENDCLKRAYTIEDTLLSCIRVFLLTRKGSRLGQNTGSFLPELLFQLIPNAQLSALADELKSELITAFPGVDFLSVVFSKDNEHQISELVVKITFTTTNQQNISELTMKLPTVFEASSDSQAQL